LANSIYSRETIARAYALDSEVCYLGIDTAFFNPSEEARTGQIVGVGALLAPKRIHLALEAVAKLEPARRKLLWVANTQCLIYREEVLRLAERLGVDFEIKLMVSDEELRQYYRTAGCILYLPRLEPFGYVPLEAAACGAPVITVAEAGLRETMADGLGIVSDGSAEAISQHICWVLDNPGLAKDRAMANVQKLVDKWGLSASIDRLEEHLLQVSGFR
jgi:glycosyltransferase involved in cell wall biosynthesis